MSQRGMTLVELLVALACFLILGGGLVMFLSVGINTWRVGEIRRESYERSQSILDQLADDLLSTYSEPSHGTGGQVDVVFLSDYDEAGQQRLRFVRSIAGETRHPITQDAGILTEGDAEYDYFDDAAESRAGRLRATGGLQEIAYVMDPDPTREFLWRGIRAPIGGANSLFEDSNIYNATQGGAATSGTLRGLRPWAVGVLYVEFNFWGPDTEAWSGARDDNALASWDSTRGILSDFPGYAESSRQQFLDDVFPSRVQMTLVLRPARVTRLARLSKTIGASETEIDVDTTQHYPDGAFQFIRIGSEWIRYEIKEGRRFSVAERGVRGTVASEHKAGSVVNYGTTFSRVLRIPASRGAGKVSRP